MKLLKKAWPWAAIAVVVIVGFMGDPGRVTRAESASGFDSTVMARLDEVIQNQQKILEGIAGIKEELRIIKIRVTQSQ